MEFPQEDPSWSREREKNTEKLTKSSWCVCVGGGGRGVGFEVGKVNLPSNDGDSSHTVLTRLECGVGTITLYLCLFLE